MRLLISWVRDFVDVKASADEIAETLGLRGFEVAAIEKRSADAVIDFEVTANRPDCLSVLGFAREIGTAYDLPIRLPSPLRESKIGLATVESGESTELSVSLEDAELCPRYAAAVADISSAGRTPAWMATRLEAAGIRPISPVVDVTNYVLLELGHPMHAFDLDELGGHALRIRRAAPHEAITTLDGVQRKLSEDMLVIADAHRAQAVAGVMGGLTSEVAGRTRRVAFESAYFKPSSVRRTSKALGLKTEASARFERGADINAPVVALQRAIELMRQIGAGEVKGPIVDRYPQPRGEKRLFLRRRRLSQLLGLDIPDGEVERILTGLGLRVEATDAGWNALAPTFRVDLMREVDLIEDVGRHYGYDKLAAAFPAMTTAVPEPDARVIQDRLIRRMLTAAGLSEAITFGFNEAASAQAFAPNGDDRDLLGVANPLSAKFDMMRPSLLPGLLEAVAHNRRHGQRDVGLFEIGSRFSVSGGEGRSLGLAWTGAANGEHWSEGAREVDLFDVKGVVETLYDAIGTPISFADLRVPYLVSGQAAAVRGPDNAIGVIGKVAPAVIDRVGVPRHDAVFVAELNLDGLATTTRARSELVQPLPRHPSVVRDLSIIVAESLPGAIIRGTIHAAGDEQAAPLVRVAFFDRYQGKGVPEGSVSISVRLTFQAPDRTLTDRDVQQAFDRILSALVREHGAVQR